MFGIALATYTAFLVATLAIIVIPGPDHVYIGAVALRDGRRAGVVAAAGMAASMTIHTLVAVTGVGAALAAIPAALDAIRILGALYLAYLGFTTLRSRSDPRAEESAPPGRIFGRAMVVNLTNPKIVLFFLAFLPQFVEPDAGAVPLQLLALGLSFAVLGFIVDALYGIAGGFTRRLVSSHGTRARTLATVSGVVYLVLAVVVAASLVVSRV